MMIDKLDRLYDLYMDSNWLGLLARFVLILSGLFLLSWCGGLPPWAWRSLFHVIPQLPALWSVYGLLTVIPMVGLLLLSALLLVAWVAFLVISTHLIRSFWVAHQELRRFNKEVETAHTRSEAILQTEPESGSFSQQPVLISTRGQAFADTNPGQPAFSAANRQSASRSRDTDEEKPSLKTSSSAMVRAKTSNAGSRGGESRQPAYSRYVRSAPRLQKSDLKEETRALYLDIGTGLDVGIKRRGSPNEDSLSASEDISNLPTAPRPNGLFIVADGMGGHGNGSEASQLAIHEMREKISRLLSSGELDGETIKAILVEGVQHANQCVYERNQQQHTQMGTTMTAALVWGTSIFVVNVGDSRTYLYRKSGDLRRVTQDHSVVAGLVEIGAISDDDVYSHPQRNEILRALGNQPTVEVDCFTVPAHIDDVLLLCSDGLWEMVRDFEIGEIVRTCAPYASPMCAMLIKSALNRGGKDNISVIAICIRED